MKRILTWIIMVALALVGTLGAGLYAIAIAVGADREQITREYSALFAFSVVGALAGIIAIAALIHRLPSKTRVPNEWLSLLVFAAAVGGGWAIMVSEQFILATPVLAVIAAVALFAFFAGLVLRWSPERSVGSRGFVLPGVWGVVGAPLTAIVGQALALIMLGAGAVAGIYFADAGLLDNVEGWIENAAETADFGLIQTPTITFAALALLGVAAPLTEELTKFLGVFILFRNRVATKYGLFIAGAAAGLGFAAVETLGYALMTAEQWPQIMLLRAPVTFIHVAATSIVALGWYAQRQTGRRLLIPFFGLAVLVHAAWNSLFVSLMILAAGIDNVDTVAPLTVLLLLAVVGAMGAVMLAAVLWIVGNARRLGREAGPMSDAVVPARVTPHFANVTTS